MHAVSYALRRRHLFELALGWTAGSAWAQLDAAPSAQAGKIVVPFHVGGISTLLAVQLARELADLGMGRYEVVHLPGMTNMLAYRAIKQRGRVFEWDILIGGPSIFTVGQSLNPFMSGDPENDLRVLTPLIYGPMVLVTSAKSNIVSWQQLANKTKPKKVAVSGLGSPSHLMAAYIDTSLFRLGQAYNTEGDIPGIQRVLSGEMDCAVVSLGSCRDHLDGSLNILMSSGSEALSLPSGQKVPSVLAVARSKGAPDFSFDNWLGAAVDIQMPMADQLKLMQAIVEAKQRASMQLFVKQIHHQPLNRSLSEMAQEIRQYADYWTEFVERLQLEKALELSPD